MKIRIDPLDTLFSRYIRLRADGKCERCGRLMDFNQLQCCHFHKRRKKSVRFDPDNALACDFGCHTYLDENPDEFRAFMKLRLGQAKLDLLDSRARITWPRPDEQLITLWLKKEISRLMKTL